MGIFRPMGWDWYVFKEKYYHTAEHQHHWTVAGIQYQYWQWHHQPYQQSWSHSVSKLFTPVFKWIACTEMDGRVRIYMWRKSQCTVRKA